MKSRANHFPQVARFLLDVTSDFYDQSSRNPIRTRCGATFFLSPWNKMPMRLSKLHRVFICGALMTSMTALPGCSLFVPKHQAITITASDPEAQLFVDGQPVGTGTTAVQLERNKSHTVTAKTATKSGAAALNKRISGVGIVDLVAGCFLLVPFLGVLGPGFWELEPENVQVNVH